MHIKISNNLNNFTTNTNKLICFFVCVLCVLVVDKKVYKLVVVVVVAIVKTQMSRMIPVNMDIGCKQNATI